MKRKTIKILLRTTADEVGNLKARLDEAEQKINDLVEQQLKNHEALMAVQTLTDDNSQKIEALLKSTTVSQKAVTKDQEKKVNRADLEARDKEFLRKISILKQAQAILRAKYEERKMKKKSVWQKLLPTWGRY